MRRCEPMKERRRRCIGDAGLGNLSIAGDQRPGARKVSTSFTQYVAPTGSSASLKS
jgi:hypothetical protein